MTLQQRFIETIAPDFARRLTDLETDLATSRQESRLYRDSLITFGDLVKEQAYGLPSPVATLGLLQEQGWDSGMIQLLVDQLGWDQLATLGSQQDEGSDERAAVVRQAVRLFRYSPLAQWSIWLWTGWGLGDKITVTLEDNTAQEWWDEFATAERNEPIMGEDTLHELSDWTLVKGNRFLALFTDTVPGSASAGQSTIRILDQDEITLVHDPEDKTDTWFYKRMFTVPGDAVAPSKTLYYPDYHSALGQGELVDKRWAQLQKQKIVASNAERADIASNGTTACIYHVSHNRKDETSAWGWPITTAAGPWIKGHKQFSEAHLGVAMAISQFVRRSRVKGGSRAVASVIGQVASTVSRLNPIETNPPGAAGSWHVENQATDTKELPMRTGASDAKADNEMFSWMALLGMGLFPTSAGLDTSRWATAVEMDKAQAMQFERYQRFWAAQYRKIVRLVLMLADKYASVSFTDEDTKAEISTDSFSLSDYPAVSEAFANQVEKMLTPYVENGIVPADTAKMILALGWRKSFEALGSDVGRDLTTDEAFEVGVESEEPPVVPPIPDEDEIEPGMDESSFVPTLTVALENLEQGHITVDQFAEFMVAEVGEVYVDSIDRQGVAEPISR